MRNNLLIKRQLRGAVVIAALAFIFYSARWTFHYFHIAGGDPDFECGDRKSGSLIVELSGDAESGGIYYLPQGTELSGLVAKAGIENAQVLETKGPDCRLSTGDKIVVGRSSLEIEKMDASTRLALDIPLDINEATVDDLILIPGIGLKTATAIIDRREKEGGISHINDLKAVRGLGKKKFDGIMKYLSVN